jgi:hypothetical protein
VSNICTTNDVFAYLGKTPTDAERSLMDLLRPMAEDLVRDYVGYTITSGTYTHFLPESNGDTGEIEHLDVVNDRVVAEWSQETDRLILPERPLRTITSIYADAAATFGQGSGDFGAGTLLTAGSDYAIEYTTSGVSWSGIIRKIAGSWPSRAGTVKVTYTAGLSAAELAGVTAVRGPKASAVRQLRLAAIIAASIAFKQGQAANTGAITSERLADYSVTYGKSAEKLFGFQWRLPAQVEEMLATFRRIAL